MAVGPLIMKAVIVTFEVVVAPVGCVVGVGTDPFETDFEDVIGRAPLRGADVDAGADSTAGRDAGNTGRIGAVAVAGSVDALADGTSSAGRALCVSACA